MPRTLLEACTFGACLGNRSLFMLNRPLRHLKSGIPPPPLGITVNDPLRATPYYLGECLEHSWSRFRNTADRTHLREALFNFQFEISIDLVTVFDAILTGRQTREKLLCLYENLMSNNFRKTAVLKNI